MTRQQQISDELEQLVARFGLVPVADALANICADRAQQIGAVLRKEPAGGIAAIVRGLGRLVTERRREGGV
jgi:hypothetical protein